MKTSSPFNLPEPVHLVQTLETELGNVYIFKELVITEFKEGANISYKTGFSILVSGLNILKFKPWFYISNRKNCYAVQPNDYKYLNSIPTLKAMAIVVYSETGRANAQLEAKFCTKPFQIFNSVLEAYTWAKSLLESENVTL